MEKFIQKIKNRFYYSIESIKNRYPCKIIKIKLSNNLKDNSIITYQAVTKLNVREATAKDILDDPLLIEKFHPTDCVKLSFLAAGEILLNKSKNIEEAKEIYKHIILEMFKDN